MLRLIVIILALITAPCSLDHYDPAKTLQVSLKFPRNGARAKVLYKPSGAGSDYVPSFVDRIRVTLVGSASGTTFRDSVRTEEGLSNTLDLSSLDLNETYSLEVAGYTCNDPDLGCCEEDETDCTSPWIKTHEAAVQDLTLDPTTENIELPITLSKIPGQLDEVPIPFNLSLGLIDTDRYCIAMNDLGAFALAKRSGGASILKYRFVDTHGRLSAQFSKSSGKADYFQGPSSCVMLGSKLIVPAYEVIDSLSHTNLLRVTPDINVDIEVNQDVLGISFNAVLNEHPIFISKAHGYSVLSASASDGLAVFRELDDNLNKIPGRGPVEICTGQCNSPRAHIINKDQFIMTSVNGTDIKAQLFSRGKTGPDESKDKVWNSDNNLHLSIYEIGSGYYAAITDAADTAIRIIFQQFGFSDFPFPLGRLFSYLYDLDDSRHVDSVKINDKYYIVWAARRGTDNLRIRYAQISADDLVGTNYSDISDNTTDANSQPRIITNPDGFTVISWMTRDGSGVGDIYFKRYLF